MTDKLTELKSKLQEATDLIKEYELLEEARRRGFVEGARYKSVKGNLYTIGHALYVSDYATLKGNIYSKDIDGNTEPGLIYRAKTNQWAEIIPEEEKKEELILLEHVHNKFVGDNFKALKELVDKHNADKPEISDYELQQIDRHIKKIDQHLHDQIREGGWEFVMRAAHMDIGIFGSSTHEESEKVYTYIKLLALSKVLNEGKEVNGSYWIIECSVSKNLYLKRRSKFDNTAAISYINSEDGQFALEFTEKEWKIFYNSEK